jgi:cytochrome c553
MQKTLVAFCWVLMGLAPAIGQPASEPAAARCEACHADGGARQTSAIPRLAGQSSAYLVGRMESMLNPASQSPHSIEAMWTTAHRLDPAMRQRIADHFARQPPGKARPGPGAGVGERIFQQGLPESGVQPCQACHGTQGEGSDAGPRLAGQRRDYLAEQLWAFNLVARAHGPMNKVAMQLMPRQIDALAAYLGGD